ncbi:MAG TPA: dihydrofolate reductase [Spirochaetia bacterium]|nr:dihydrofolate reductase [Spirochaetia bacterium]
MIVTLVAAVAANGVIGDGGRLPWKLPDDMKRFRALTLGHAVIMGRSTYASLGKPLAGRHNIVLSRDPGLSLPGCRVVHSVAEARAAAGEGREADPEVFVIGGAAVYAAFLPDARRLCLTWIDRNVPGDVTFPPVEWDAWRVTRETAGAPNAAWPHRFVDYERIRP